MTKPLFIISASVLCVDEEENARRNARLVYDICTELGHTISFQPAQGMYKSKAEQCYIVYLPESFPEGVNPASTLLDLAEKYNQETVLLVNADKEGTIFEVATGDTILEGPWTELPEGVDPDTDDYTDVDGVKYQIGRRIDYPELEGKTFRFGNYTLKVLGCNYDIGFTAYDTKGDPTKKMTQIVCCVGPNAPSWDSYKGDIEDHNSFFDNCVKAVQDGHYISKGGGLGSVSCAFSA